MLSHVRTLFIIVLLLAVSTTAQADPIDNQRPELASGGSGFYGFVAGGFSSPGLDDVAVFDLQTNDFLPPPTDINPEGNFPYDATLTPSEDEVWVVGQAGDGLVVVDTTNFNVTQRINHASFDAPSDVAFSLDGNRAYVGSRLGDDLMTVIDTNTYAILDTYEISSTLTGAVDPGKMAIHPTTGDIYIVDWFDDYLYVLDENTGAVLQEMDAGTSLWDLTFDTNGEKLYVIDRGPDEVVVIDVATFSIETTIPTGADPQGVDITPDDSTLFVANEDDATVTVINAGTNSVLTTIELSLPPIDPPAQPRDLELSNDGAFAYVPTGNWAGDDGVFVIETATRQIVETILVAPAVNTSAIAIMQIGDTTPLPVASFEFQPVVQLGDTATFTDTSQFNPTSWAWEFGDGGSSASQNPTYQYAAAGSYTVTLTVGNNAGMDSTSNVVLVEGKPEPVEYFIHLPLLEN